VRTTPNASVEYHRDLYRDLDADTAARNRAARAELPCSECGSDAGMQPGWTRDALRLTLSLVSEHPPLYYLEDDDHRLFSACWQCNPQTIIPHYFTPLTPEQVAAWLGRECQCLDCKRERGE